MEPQLEKPTFHSPLVRNIFFWTGIIATFAYRIINIVTRYSALWAQILWYIGTVGFILYFIHRYQISEKRAKLIRQHDLDTKLANLTGLSADEKAAMEYIFKTLLSSKEKLNYIFIFTISAVALLIGIYTDVIAR